ncbi:MAG: hypothetical protein MI923_10100 [Phycisphaerales bacterium]|nr:hypothetical protein [Phycisphaerales bacterium]
MAKSVHSNNATFRWGIAAGVALLTLVVRLPWLSSPGFVIDQAYFVQWSEISRSPSQCNPPGGLGSVYQKKIVSEQYWCNYPPVYILCLRVLAGLYDILAPADHALDAQLVRYVANMDTSAPTRLAYALYKIPAVAADVILAALLFLLLVRRRPWRQALAVAALYGLMPAVIHNSTIWGQVDAIPTLLLVISLEMARRRQLVWMTIVAALAVLTKAQSVMMAPLWLVVAIGWGRWDGRRWLAMLGSGLAVVVVVLFPFRFSLDGVAEAYLGAANYYPFTHLNGFSAWFLKTPMTEPHLAEMSIWYASDLEPGFLGVRLRHWGLIGVFAVWAYAVVMLWRRRCDDHTLAWAARVLPLAFFLWSTQMHERYLFPAIGVWAWSFYHSRRWWLAWIAIGLCSALNQLWVWPGHPDAVWTDAFGTLLYRPWLGMAPGVWCSFALIVVFFHTLIAREEGKKDREEPLIESG